MIIPPPEESTRRDAATELRDKLDTGRTAAALFCLAVAGIVLWPAIVFVFTGKLPKPEA